MDWWTDPDIARTAGAVAKRYRGFVDLEDVKSVLVLWCLENPTTAARAAEGPAWFWQRRLWSIAQRFARKEKAEVLGHEIEDEFFYSPRLVKELLPDAFDKDAPKPTSTPSEIKAKNNFNPGGADWETMMADLRRCLQLLSKADFDILYGLFSGHKKTLTAYCEGQGWDYRTGVKKQRLAMRRLIDLLGGVTPWASDLTEGPRKGPPEPRRDENTLGAVVG